MAVTVWCCFVEAGLTGVMGGAVAAEQGDRRNDGRAPWQAVIEASMSREEACGLIEEQSVTGVESAWYCRLLQRDGQRETGARDGQHETGAGGHVTCGTSRDSEDH
eukprot:562772-Rhodomonas_salina.1